MEDFRSVYDVLDSNGKLIEPAYLIPINELGTLFRKIPIIKVKIS